MSAGQPIGTLFQELCGTLVILLCQHQRGADVSKLYAVWDTFLRCLSREQLLRLSEAEECARAYQTAKRA